MAVSLLLAVFALAGVTAAPPPAPQDDEAAIAALLDAFHAAAARADESAYFGCFAPEGVFLGTDATERWTLAEFRAYAHPHFAAGKGWTYVPQERHVEFGEGARIAWFDEVLRNEKYGLCRGTGVVTKGDGGWRVAHYSLTFLVPNEVSGAVVLAIQGTAPKD